MQQDTGTELLGRRGDTDAEAGESSNACLSGQHPTWTSNTLQPRSERTPLTPLRRRKWRKKLLYLAAHTRLLENRGEPPKGWLSGSKILLFGSKLNALLLLAIVIPLCLRNKSITFILACLVLLPLAALLGDVTEKVAFHTSETIGGLLNATFGNATEALVSIFALRKGLVRVVQVSLLGSVLSNMLLVLGSAFVAAGMKVKLAHFNKTAATANTGLLLVAVLALLVPAMLESAQEITDSAEMALSRSTSILMLGVYVAYLNFQLSSHSKLFDEEAELARHAARAAAEVAQTPPPHYRASIADVAFAALATEHNRAAAHERAPMIGCGGTPPLPPGSHLVPPKAKGDDEDEFVLRLDVALGWLAIITVLVALFSELLTDTLEAFSLQFALPDAFVGFVLLPLVGNAAEHATAISMAYRSKMDLAVAVALGSSTQIALFVLPLMVVIAWIIHQPLDLAFGSFETACCAFSVIIVTAQAQMGEVHYLNGICLVVAYFIIAMSFYYIQPV